MWRGYIIAAAMAVTCSQAWPVVEMKIYPDYKVDAAGGVVFRWDGNPYYKPAHMKFPVVITDAPNDIAGYLIREATNKDHRERVAMCYRGEWRRWRQIGRESPLKFWVFELTHAIKNLYVEELRSVGLWNRRNRNPNKPDGYIFGPRR